MRDQEARESNLIVYNAEESKKEAHRDKQRADTFYILTLFRDQMERTGFKEEYILNVTRPGQKQDVQNRPNRVNLDAQATKTIFSEEKQTAKL